MQIQEIKFSLLSIPTNPARSSAAEIASGRSDKITTLVVRIKTKSGIEGIGFAYSLSADGAFLSREPAIASYSARLNSY